MDQSIVCIIGAGGTGKDTIKKYLLEKNSNYKVLLPVTTRPMRDNEEDGVDYMFTDNKTFDTMIKDNILLEHRKYEVFNDDNDVWYYGFMKPSPNSKVNIVVCPLEAYISIKSHALLKSFSIIPFYIYLKPSVRLERMIKRENENSNPNYKELARRFFADENDFSTTKLNDAGLKPENCYYINNIDSLSSAEFINNIINKERRDNYGRMY